MSTENTPIAEPASLWLRLTAACYDLLPLLAIWFFTAVACLALTGGALDYHAWWYRIALLATTAAYFVASWTRGGQTIGMRAWRVRVVRNDGAPVDAQRALLRFVLALISLGAAGLGFVWALFDADKRAWHDRAAGTRLVRVSGPANV